MAPEGGDGGPVRAVPAPVPWRRGPGGEEEAAARQQPSAAHVGDAARQQDPEERGERAAEALGAEGGYFMSSQLHGDVFSSRCILI